VEREHATASIHLRKTEPAARREEAMMRRLENRGSLEIRRSI